MPDSFRLESSSDSIGTSKQEIRIIVQNFDNGTILEWNVKKFYDKLEEIKAIMDSYNEGNDPVMDGEANPFNESSEPIQLGMAYYKLEGLIYLMDNPATISIVGKDSKIVGKLEVNIIPCCEDGDIDIPEDLLPEYPEQLIDNRIDFIV